MLAPMSSHQSSGQGAQEPSCTPGEHARARAGEHSERIDQQSARALAQRCDELQAQVASMSAAAAIRASIIEEQVVRIGDLERHLTAVDALVRELQRQLGQSPAAPQFASAPNGLARRAYRGARRRAGAAVRRLKR